MATYTVQICANSKVFPRELCPPVADKIVAAATEAYLCAWKANKIRVTGVNSALLAKTRLELQKKAILEARSMFPLIELAWKVYHLDSSRVEYWSRKTYEAIGKLEKWRESDVKRYAKIIKAVG